MMWDLPLISSGSLFMSDYSFQVWNLIWVFIFKICSKCLLNNFIFPLASWTHRLVTTAVLMSSFYRLYHFCVWFHCSVFIFVPGFVFFLLCTPVVFHQVLLWILFYKPLDSSVRFELRLSYPSWWQQGLFLDHLELLRNLSPLFSR